jgi:hypothetical protein
VQDAVQPTVRGLDLGHQRGHRRPVGHVDLAIGHLGVQRVQPLPRFGRQRRASNQPQGRAAGGGGDAGAHMPADAPGAAGDQIDAVVLPG